MAKIERVPLVVESKAPVTELLVSRGLCLNIDGRTVDVSWMGVLCDAELYVKELEAFVRGQRRSMATANSVIRYFRFVCEVGESVGRESLVLYREYLEGKESIGGNTKAQVYASATSYFKFLIGREVIGQCSPPKNIPWPSSKPKATILELARGGASHLVEELHGDIIVVQERLNIGPREATSLVLCEHWLSVLGKLAFEDASQQIKDWQYLAGIATRIDGDSARKSRILKVSDSAGKRCKLSMRLALSILYCMYGYNLPPKKKWPVSVADCFVNLGWNVSRVDAAFFPNIKSLDAFLMLGLVNKRLMPNVDSVAFYTYLNSVTLGDDKSSVIVNMDKYRGKGAIASFSIHEPLVIALAGLIKKVEMCLPKISGGSEWLAKTDVPAFLKRSTGKAEVGLKTMDPSMTAVSVRRFISGKAQVEPSLQPLVGLVTGENFRPTHVLVKHLRGRSIFEIQADAGHARVTTTQDYAKGVELQSHIMQRSLEYQKYIITESLSAAQKRVGNGYLCSSTSEEEERCIAYDKCFNCDSRLVVFESVEIAAEWVAWRRHITSNSDYLRVHRAERWFAIWEPMLAKYETFLAVLNSASRKKAEELAEFIVLPHLN